MPLCDELEAKLRQADADGGKLINAAVRYVLEAVREAPGPLAIPEFVSV